VGRIAVRLLVSYPLADSREQPALGLATAPSSGWARDRTSSSAASVRPGSSIMGRCPEFSNQHKVRLGAVTSFSQPAAISDGVVLSRRPSRKKLPFLKQCGRASDTQHAA
jgi:hypothetical protein